MPRNFPTIPNRNRFSVTADATDVPNLEVRAVNPPHYIDEPASNDGRSVTFSANGVHLTGYYVTGETDAETGELVRYARPMVVQTRGRSSADRNAETRARKLLAARRNDGVFTIPAKGK